ncbi:calmodulin-binding transcription activator 2-like [Rana temporaria]|uniref:calmodulin-binding transcription activator 2-like n=1 Tax=Rana temporaria TaxID=8407 RepID=UPI001AAD805F|nr:calmodulin-binding transcription activator 2-like [Rana temporaria]
MNSKDCAELSAENGHHIKVFLPKKLLECLPKCTTLPKERLRWNTNEEIASYLITFEKHDEWLSCAPKTSSPFCLLSTVHGIKWSCSNGNGTSEFSIEQLVQQTLETHQAKPPPRTHTCLCNTNLGSVGGVPHKCTSTKHRIISPKVEPRLCPFPALTEVQNISSSSAEPDQGKDRRPGNKGSKTPLGNDPSSSHSFPELPDTTQASPPLALSNGFYTDRELAGVTITTTSGVPGISAVLVMTGIPEKPLALTPSQHLMPADPGTQPATVPVGISLLPSPVEGLLLSSSQSLEVAMEAASGGSAGTFDPDSFLNSPKEGQTYGGAAKMEGFKTEIHDGRLTGSQVSSLMQSSELTQSDLVVKEEEEKTVMEEQSNKAEESVSHSSEVEMEDSREGQVSSSDDVQTDVVSSVETQEDSEAPGSHINDLYSIIQNDLSSSSGASSVHMELSAENFNISFDSQFPDLISDLMTEESAPGGYEQFGEPQASSSPVVAVYGQQVQQQPPPQPMQPMNTATTAVTDSFPEAGDGAIGLVGITDFSPEWSYPEGGVKILITGPWVEDSDSYSCVFDHVTVPASLIQLGVLRCYCPAHEAGLVTLQVIQHQQVISHSVIFEYRARNFLSLPSTQLDWLSLDDNQFRMSILERLEQMERRMADMSSGQLQHPPAPSSGHRSGDSQVSSADSFEARLVAVCEKMMSQTCWVTSDLLAHEMSFRGMTLLHLAAAQGYARLIETLIQWRSLHSQSLVVELEVDPLNVDHFSCTPLMWACALGHTEAATLLFRWDCRALSIPDSLGRFPLGVARSRGHVKLASTLEEMQRQEAAPGNFTELHSGSWHSLMGSQEIGRGLSPISTSADTGLSSLPSPSDVSDGSISATSAYSSSSALRGSLDCSPESSQDTPVEASPNSRLLGAASWDLEDPVEQGQYLDSPGAVDAGLLQYREDTENRDFLQVDMVTLAEQIIEATPDRIKQDDFTASDSAPLRERSGNLSKTMAWLASYLDTADQMPGLPPHGEGMRAARALARFAQMSPGEDGSSLGSHADVGAFGQRSKRVNRRSMEGLRVKVTRSEAPPSPTTPPPLGEISFERFDPPGAARWSEFLSASSSGRMESEFALLTLSDHEQRELYEAARVIQTAFRKYKGRRLKEQQDLAAAVIQRCYRKYKQLTWIALKYALYKKMTQAAILIQSKFRSYYEQKRFQQSRRAAVLIQQCYRSYREGARGGPALQHRLKGSFLTKKQDQAARKIMRFLRRCSHRMKELKQTQDLECLQKRGLAK